MNILVCVKQVPDTTQIKIDPVKHTLIREGVPAILNPFDGYALEAAARIKYFLHPFPCHQDARREGRRFRRYLLRQAGN